MLIKILRPTVRKSLRLLEKKPWSHIKGTLRSVMIATAIPRPVYEKYMSRLLCKNDLMLMLKTRVIIAPINTRPRYAFTT